MKLVKVKKIVKVISLSLICPLAFAGENETTATDEFKPSFHMGVLMHTYVGFQQRGFNTSEAIHNASKWNTDFTLYRTRIMAEAQLTKKDYLFVETELTASIGTGGDKAAGIKILDAQYDHIFADFLKISAGKILVSHNRNGLQTAATLMANDFTYFQYPYNMSKDSPLQNDLGRDIGLNLSGGFVSDKLKYRLGAFAGRRDFEGEDSAPVRVTGRVEYNFLDIDNYSGTNLGMGKTCTLAGGFDTQGTYVAGGADLFVDCPLGHTGSVTLNTAYSYITGGNDPEKKYSFAAMIPAQHVTFLELGYYFKHSKLQPWLRYERQDMQSESYQTGDLTTGIYDKLNTTTVFGGGLNYFFNDYTTNIRLSYVAMTKGVDMGNEIKNKTYGQIWLQLQLCLF